MALGQYRHSITVEQAVETRDGTGDPVKAWSTYCIRRASVEPLNGREFFAAKQMQAKATVRIRVHYDAETALITPKMRVSWDSKVFDIVSPPINPGRANKELLLMCEQE